MRTSERKSMKLNPGDKFHKLTFVEKIDSKFSVFKCDCGVTTTKRHHLVLNSNTKSCGCFNRQLGRDRFKTHGLSETPTFKIWTGMMSRCYVKKNTGYKQYGAKGVTVCERWKTSFINFLNDMGERPAGLSLDRIDGTRGYSPENCRWATRKQQRENQNRKIIEATIDGVRRPMKEWAKLKGFYYSTIHQRIKTGYTPEEALSYPPGGKKSRRIYSKKRKEK